MKFSNLKAFMYLCICFVFSLNSAMASVLLIPHTQISPESLSSQTQSLYPNHYIQAHPLEQNEQLLLDYFEKAQKYYAIKSYDLALENYKNAAQLLLSDDWRLIHRKALVLSLLRLSELDPTQSQIWLRKAVSFGADISFQQFDVSPQTLKLTTKLHPLPSIEWDLSAWSDSFDTVLVNGRVISLKKIQKIKIPDGDYKIVFLSAYYLPQMLLVSQKQIPFLQPVKIPFVSGNCKSPAVAQIESQFVEVMFSQCRLIQNSQKEWIDKNTPSISSSVPPAHLLLQTASPSIPFYKEKWFVVVTALTLGGLGYYFYTKNKKTDKDSSPTATSLGEY